MKKFLFFVLAFAGMLIYYSCSNQTGKGNLVSTAEMNISIDGMTCASGCAKAIEKTVAELAGVTYSKVDFEAKTATFKFDDSKTSDKAILEAIAALNEGQYKVSNVELKIEKKNSVEEDSDNADAVEEKLLKDTLV